MITFIVAFLMNPAVFVKNMVGRRKGYGRCPNCNNSWYWKTSKSVTFKKFGRVSKGVLICVDCLASPKSLDLERIERTLIESQWDKEEATLARKAVKQLMAT